MRPHPSRETSYGLGMQRVAARGVSDVFSHGMGNKEGRILSRIPGLRSVIFCLLVGLYREGRLRS